MELKTSTIYCGDNLEILRGLPDKCVDLIYADPPFFSNRHYEIIWNDGAELKAFKDRWKGGINQYIKWMRDRLMECHRVLKDTGSMYLHCDWHANAHLRILMDRIFGEQYFQREIIWDLGNPSGYKSLGHNWIRGHDTLFFYTKGATKIFNKQYEPYSEKYKIFLRKHRPNQSTKKGIPITDVWKGIQSMQCQGVQVKERIGYPTQKPEALLKRVIEASSNINDIVLDPFCGCGTTISVAQQLSRRWIGIDVSPTACMKMEARITKKFGSIVELIGMPATIEHLDSLEPFQFQSWVVHRINGSPSNRKVNDKGIDGFDFYRNPIQIKQSKRVGRNVVDNFETAIRRAGYNEGLIYAFSFTRGAYDEVARASNDDNLNIKLVNVADLLNNATISASERQGQLINKA